MTRLFAFLAAILVSILAVSAATATASEIDTIRFSLEPAREAGKIQASFSANHDRNRNRWNSDFTGEELVGLDMARLRAAEKQPVRFALMREAGRLDCAGTGARSRASGDCRFTADAAYTNFLVSRGMRRPSQRDSFALMSLDVRRALVEALYAARYPAPRVDDLISLAAVGVDSGYITGLARAGYRPPDLGTLLEFKAIGITPAYIQGFVRHGYGKMDPDELVQLKALDISGDFVASFEKVGYRNLSADQLVQLKALGVTPDFAQAVRRGSAGLPTPERLVELRAIGFRPR